MADWVRWAIGLGLPVVLTWAGWMTHRVQTHHQTLYGPTDSNGMRGDLAEVRREVFGGVGTDALLTRARHDARNAVAAPLAELEDRVTALEQRRRG